MTYNWTCLRIVRQLLHLAHPPPPHNITVEYAQRQISKRERNLLQYLSTLVYKSEFVDKIAVAISLDNAALLAIQAIYYYPKKQNGLPRNTLHTIFWSHGMQVCPILQLKNCVSYEKFTMPWAMTKILKCI